MQTTDASAVVAAQAAAVDAAAKRVVHLGRRATDVRAKVAAEQIGTEVLRNVGRRRVALQKAG